MRSKLRNLQSRQWGEDSLIQTLQLETVMVFWLEVVYEINFLIRMTGGKAQMSDLQEIFHDSIEIVLLRSLHGSYPETLQCMVKNIRWFSSWKCPFLSAILGRNL